MAKANKTLTIVIPTYGETGAELQPLISSIDNQLGIDFNNLEVIIVDDAYDWSGTEEDTLKCHYWNINNFKVIHREENGGPGLCRQTGLEAATGDYVMFCDADDTLHNVGVLGAFFSAMNEEEPDIISSDWLEELEINGSLHYIEHSNEATWMHGKAFRRSFIEYMHLSFHETLRVHEDSYFLSNAYALTQSTHYINAVTYVWKWSEDSITRRDGGSYTYDSMPEFNRAISLSIEWLKARRVDVSEKVAQVILYNFFTLEQAHWQGHKEELKLARESVPKYFGKFESLFRGLPPEVMSTLYSQERIKNGKEIETRTLEQWLTEIKYPKGE